MLFSVHHVMEAKEERSLLQYLPARGNKKYLRKEKGSTYPGSISLSILSLGNSFPLDV